MEESQPWFGWCLGPGFEGAEEYLPSRILFEYKVQVLWTVDLWGKCSACGLRKLRELGLRFKGSWFESLVLGSRARMISHQKLQNIIRNISCIFAHPPGSRVGEDHRCLGHFQDLPCHSV